MIVEDLKKIYSVLNQIEIKGEQNIACMFVALTTLNKILEEIDIPQEKNE